LSHSGCYTDQYVTATNAPSRPLHQTDWKGNIGSSQASASTTMVRLVAPNNCHKNCKPSYELKQSHIVETTWLEKNPVLPWSSIAVFQLASRLTQPPVAPNVYKDLVARAFKGYSLILPAVCMLIRYIYTPYHAIRIRHVWCISAASMQQICHQMPTC
jgi:hypothetical protein